MTPVDRTAYPRFGRVVSGRELAEAFTPTDAEVEWAQGKTQDQQHLLALVVWLKSYQRLGYFPKVEDVPLVVVRHVRGVLGLGEDVALERAAVRSAKRHREFIRKRMKVVYDGAGVRKVSEEAIRRAVLTKDNPADLINVALEELVRARCELPGYTTLDAMAATIRTEVNSGFYQSVAGRLDAVAKARLARMLVVDPISRRSEFDRLKDVAQAASLGKFKQRLELLEGIDAIRPTEVWLNGVPPGKIAHFAGEARVTDVADMKKITTEDKRMTLIVCFVHAVRTGVRDDVVTMFCKRMAAIHKKGRERLEALREAHRAESERLLGVFGDVLSVVVEATAPEEEASAESNGDASVEGRAPDTREVAERAGRLVLKTLEKAGGVEVLAAAHEAVSAHHGNNYLPLLEQYYGSHRAALFTLVNAITLESTSADRSVVDAVEFLRALRGAKAAFVPERLTVERVGADGQPVTVTLSIDIDGFASAMWKKILRDKQRPGMLVRRHVEICVFSYLAAELRSGDIAVAGSESYANLHEQLMSWQECEPLVARFCEQAGIPSEPSQLTAFFQDKLAALALSVDAGYPSNIDLVLEGGRPVLKRRKGAERRPEALELEAALHDRLPQRALLDILTRTAYLLGWHHHFGPASGSDPKIKEALARYVLTVFAHGTLLGPSQVAAHMRGKISVHELSLAGNKHATASKIEKASATVVNAFNKLDVAGVWGDGKTVAADGSQIDTWENNLLAETSIRYGGYGGIAYRHVSNTYVALFSHFIPCGVWEAVYIIEGLLKNTSDVQPDTIHADTQGQSLPVFGLAALLGFDLLPRIRNWHDLIFYRPALDRHYQHIDSLFGDEAVDWGLIEAHWTDLLRTAISIRENRMSSVTLLRRLGHHSRKNRLYRAFRELGRAIRTITLLRYLSEPQLREQITRVTNRNEAFHGFADWLMFGGKLIGHNDPDYQEKVIKFNELLANCVMYSTALDITDSANEIAAEGQPVDLDDLATVSPYITHTVRRFGNWTLNLTPPDGTPNTRLDLEPRVLFAAALA
ncbi:Tn3 family transposase [Sphaerisporangium perillae]|uniref:Tn3 family transposase n=1 Tax=Sphaerisporangium perillae TaxID=2935860 RepID=UPI00200E3532|nr:Tn3 family transposase [Sphaerisporangium perillae]